MSHSGLYDFVSKMLTLKRGENKNETNNIGLAILLTYSKNK